MSQYPGGQVIVVKQPKSKLNGQNAWNTSLMSCCDDLQICLCGLFCPFCLGCEIAGAMGECCCCGTSVAMRTLIRTKYNIQGSICNDHCIHECCLMCSLCQMKREINYQHSKVQLENGRVIIN
eukprot:gi/632944188/ref/XP_007887362.1/ PREDICTED: placenta-specific gene 8 protein-like [Callorhinchus milii]